MNDKGFPADEVIIAVADAIEAAGSMGPPGAGPPPIEVTVFRNATGPLSKRFGLTGDGKLEATAACQMSQGFARRVRVHSVEQIAELIASMQADEFMTSGRLRRDLPDRVEVTTKAKLSGGAAHGLIARSQEYLVFEQNEPALMLLDHDTKGMPAAIANRLDEFSGGFWDALVRVAPALANAARVTRSSTSSGLFNSATGAKYPGSRNAHLYLLAADAADIPRATRDLHERLWLRGFGFYVVGKNGQLLDRSIIDVSVGAPEHPIFEGPPVLAPPVAQDATVRRPAVVKGAIIDTRTAILPLNTAEQRQVTDIKASAREIADSAAQFAAEHVLSRERAEAIAKSAAAHMPEAEFDGGAAKSAAAPLGLTIATCPRGQLAAKRFLLDARGVEQSVDYDAVRLWLFQSVEFVGLDDLAKLLGYLAAEPRACVLRGQPIVDDPRRWQARQWASDAPTLRPVARQWLALDIDGGLVAAPLGRADRLGEAAEFVRDHRLPPEFKGVRAIVSATAATGRRGDTTLRCRLWFLLDRSIADVELYHWGTAFRAVTDFPLDPSVLQTGQPNYVARPIFHTPLVDPVPDHCRVMILPGCDDQVALNLDRYAERHRAIEREIAGKIKLAGGGWREAAHAAIGGPNSFYVPIVQVIGRAVAQEAMDAEICSAIGKLIEDRADPVRKRQYNTRWLARQVEGIRRLDDKRYGVGGPAWATWSRQISPEQIAVLDAFAREYQQREEPSAEELAKLQAFAVAQLTGGRADV